MSYDPRSIAGTPYAAALVPQLPLGHGDPHRRLSQRCGRGGTLLPSALSAVGDLVLVHIYRMHDANWFGAYGKSAIQIPVVHPPTGTRGAFSPLLFVEGDGPVAAGREIYGQPKKAGTITLDAHGDLLVGRVVRNGIEIVTVTTPYKQRQGTSDDLERHAAFRTRQSQADPGSRRGRRLGLGTHGAHPRRRRDSRGVEGAGDRRVATERPGPVHLLPVLDVLEAFHRRVDFSLDYGEVIERF